MYSHLFHGHRTVNVLDQVCLANQESNHDYSREIENRGSTCHDGI